MNLPEFKAWFEGYTEDMTGPPSKKQWKRICERVNEIVEYSTTYPVFIDRYVRPYFPWWSYPTCVGVTTVTASNTETQQNSTGTYVFNSSDAFRELGRLESQG